MGSVASVIAQGPRPIDIDPTLGIQRRIQIGELQAQQQERIAQAQTLQAQAQERQAAFTDQAALRRAFMETRGDWDKIPELATQYGARPAAIQAGLAANEKLITDRTANSAEENKLTISHHDQLRGQLAGIAALPEDQRSAAAASFWGDPNNQKLWAPGEHDRAFQTFGNLADDNVRAALDATLNTGSKAAEEANNRIKAASERTQADTAAAREAREQQQFELQAPGIQAESERKQMITAAMKAATADPTKGALAIDAAIPANVDQQANASYKAAWTAAMQAGSPEAAARIVEAAAQHSASLSPATQAAATNKAVATAKAEMPIKIATAGAEAKARMDAMTPPEQAIDMMAEKVLAGGSVPMARNPIMMGKIYERAGQLAQSRGLTDQQAVMEGFASKANQTALTSVTKQYETLKPFADMAEKNASILEDKVKNVTNLGAPFLNTPVRELEQKFAGNKDVAAFRAAMLPVQADFARILSSPTAAGVLTDAARHEMEGALSAGATPGQIKAALDVFRTDARNRKVAYEQQLQELKGKTVVSGPQSAAPAANTPASTAANTAPKPTHRYNPQTGKIEPIP